MTKKKDTVLTLRDLASFTEEVLLPGVEKIVEIVVKEHVDVLAKKMDVGFLKVDKSIRVLGGDVAEVKVTNEDHEKRIRHLEHVSGVR